MNRKPHTIFNTPFYLLPPPPNADETKIEMSEEMSRLEKNITVSYSKDISTAVTVACVTSPYSPV